jgi:chemotaxis family two-component system response regulator Rcp1
MEKNRSVNILLVEHNKSDVKLIREAFNGGGSIKGEFKIIEDGKEAIDYLISLAKERNGHFRPDMILLDLNLPSGNGLEVLEEIKASSELRTIPVVVLTSSSTDEQINKSYDLNANCYIIKPEEQEKFISVVRLIGSFWFDIAKLPSAN